MILICCSREEFMHWVEMLPDTQTPSWLGLPSNAEKVLLTTQGMPQSHLNHLQTKNTGSFFLIPRLSWSLKCHH